MFLAFAAVLSTAVASAARESNLEEVVVTGIRPLKEVGIQKTDFDSIALRETPALSMADVLTFNSGVFVKNYGRATLSTVAFRGTSPSHTQVTWNGMRINSPMLGMTDFSTIPAFFIDGASLLHGTSSVVETGGGLGGLVRLTTLPDAPDGFGLQYTQGVGSFSTFDEFLRLTYHNKHWTVSTRVLYSSSPNDYTYINHDRKENIYDDGHNIIGQYYPKEKNRSGAYKDFQALQEVYYDSSKGDRIGLNAWVVRSLRELPMLTTDYGDERDFVNKQRETTVRALLDWTHRRSSWEVALKGGYTYTRMAYDYRREIAEDLWAEMTRARSNVNTFFLSGEGVWYVGNKWRFDANLSLHQQFVRTEDKNVIQVVGDKAIVGYDKARLEFSAALSARWQPTPSVGLGLTVREDIYGVTAAAPIPALFVDWMPLNTLVGEMPLSVTFKGSTSRNYRFPSLNDLYFLPGGNPDLKSESGFTYDAGISITLARDALFTLEFDANWFDSSIDDWIIWLPTVKGFFSPRNIASVHAYGVELNGTTAWQLGRGWGLDLNGSFSWTPSINKGEPYSEGDLSVGKQLPYVPKYSAAVTGRLTWRGWGFLYKWCHYSERFTMTSNEQTITGHLPPYFMSNVSLDKDFSFNRCGLQLKLAVNNLFNEDYVSVLSRPMPGINFEFFVTFLFN